MSLQNYLTSGLLALSFLWFLLTMLVGGASFPDYSHVSQFISELGATGAPHGWTVSVIGFIPTGVLLMLFVFVMAPALPTRAARLTMFGFGGYAASYIAAGFFPCDFGCNPEQPSFSQLIHNFSALPGYLLGVACLVALAWQSRRWSASVWLFRLGMVLSASALIGLLTLDPSMATVGLSQRLIEFSIFSWFGLLVWQFAGVEKIETDSSDA